jgi:hypothetical protein
LYFVFVTSSLGNPILQFIGLLIFFPIAHYISKWVGLGGLKGIGLFFHQSWLKNLLLSMVIGFGFWMVWYGMEFWIGTLRYIGVKPPSELLMPIVEIVVGFFMGSLINDLIIRGYVMNLLKGKLPIFLVFTISILLYVLDDYWYAGFSLSNVIFSIILGLSLSLAFYKTGSIWANTGIHYGLNIAYGLFYGMAGKAGSGIFIIEETDKASALTEILPFIIPGIMFIFVWWVLQYYAKTTRVQTNNSLEIN